MEEKSVLIVDDEEQLRSLLKRIISLEGYEVYEAGNLKKAEYLLERHAIDIVLCDVKLPDGNGVEFISSVKSKHPSTEILLLTAYGNISDGIQAMKNGAFDYLVKGNDNDKIIPILARVFEKQSLQKRVRELEKQVTVKYSFDNIIGKSPLLIQAIHLAKKVSPLDTTVLILGETGTGKEVFAQSIHHGSKRSTNPFLALNCSAFSKELLESEIFGHKAGAFTGATKDKKGLIEEANSGTLFLDEIGEMHIDLQSKLLRVLETNEFIKVGDTKSTRINVRFIAATNRELQKEVDEGKFRQDLYYRLNVFTITLPSLNDRLEDIQPLANYFLQLYSLKMNKKIESFSKEAMKKLTTHNWKGNIRELKNVVERSVILSDNKSIEVEDLPIFFNAENENTSITFDLASVEKIHIRKVLQFTKGNKTKAAELLGIGLTTLYRKMEEYTITS
jgi:two-component system, NtrC family, response regulator